MGCLNNHARALPRFSGDFTEAQWRVRSCECGAETSCYACLRNFRNQRFHEQFSRSDALTLLTALAGTHTV
ncbi:MAG: hypothetical protein JO362_21025 [Streptomycetaceae bacterium]|nr:hypothetical protein [Streptomycetaceae bacterium]